MTHWLWRAIDRNGEGLDNLVQQRRPARAAKPFLSRQIVRWGKPRVIVTVNLLRPHRHLMIASA
mgnify:CR=1 FL=1